MSAIGPDAADRTKTEDGVSEADRQLEWASLHDSLTGLPNRAVLVDRLTSLDRRHLHAAALVLVDLDDFRDVNDTYGHAEGDELLRAMASRMRSCIRRGDLLARLGGDEFAVLLEGAGTTAAETLVERLVEAINTPFAVAGQATHVTASVGIAFGTAADTKPEELLRFADLAMYEAKSNGKDRFATFNVAMSDALTFRTRTEGELRQAIERDQLLLHYQPVVDLDSGRMVGAEALVRWQHPERGLLNPDEFIPVAERTGAIVPLGAWALRAACRQSSAWRDEAPDRARYMAVNVSARQLDNAAFVATISDVLNATGIDATSLCLEVTETAVMANPSHAQKVVRTLRGLGVWLAIDDFGTGYASLTYLRRLHAAAVKIDSTFVDGLGHELEDTTIVTAVIGLAHAMGLSVTAEGVETAEQLLILRDMGCDHAQGDFICPAVTPDELTGRLDTRWFDPPPTSAERSARRSDAGALLHAVPTRPRRERFRVVVADENENDRLRVRRELEASGHFDVVGEAVDGELAVHMAAARQPHLVLLDLTMPKIDGLAVLPRILLAAPGTKVVLLSGHASPGSVDRALAIGAAGFYKKGLDNLAAELLPLTRDLP